MKNKMECQINLDQLKTLILIKGEEKRVGRFLPSFISYTITFPICFSSVYSIVPPNLPTEASCIRQWSDCLQDEEHTCRFGYWYGVGCVS